MVVCLLFRFVHWMGMVNLLVTVGYLAIRVVAVSWRMRAGSRSVSQLWLSACLVRWLSGLG
ncbi:Uncharacterised protein [Mycobacteroides abscessus subsp. massiliense]|nr:Uncharacterised protein [Mycobacteroides abscessus subsp. massiliense]